MHRPGNVVADRQVVQHVPDEHAHVVVSQELEAGDVQPGPLRGTGPERPAVGLLAVRLLPGLASRIDADRVARLERDPARPRDVIELPAVHGPVPGHRRHPAVARHVQEDPARDDALGPVLDGAEGGPVERDLLLRIAPVPHRLLVPRVAERVDVGGRDAVVEDAVVVGREATLAARQRPHVVLRGQSVVGARLLGKRAAHRDAPPRADEPGGGRALRRRDQIDRAELIVLPPAPPVAAIADQGAHFLLGWQRTLGHVVPSGRRTLRRLARPAQAHSRRA